MLRSAVVLSLFAALAVAPAQAAVVTFDDSVGQNASGGYQAGVSFSDQGLTFTYSPTGSAYMYLGSASDINNGTGGNGTNALIVGANSSDTVIIKATSGNLFSISSLLLGINEPANAQTTDTVLVNGTSVSIGTTAATYAVNTGNVSSVTISGLVKGGYVAIDNLNYQVQAPQQVPEPATIAVLGAGLVGLTFGRRRNKTPNG